MMALVNGVYIGFKEGFIAQGDMLCLQTDCMPAIQKLYGKRPPTSSGEQEVVDYFNKLVKRMNIRFYFKHVRGHTRNTDGRSSVNRRCDEKARKHMQKMRLTLKIKALRETLV